MLVADIIDDILQKSKWRRCDIIDDILPGSEDSKNL